MPFITVDKENSSDIRIHYEDHGQGEEVLVLIHGYPFSGTAWEKEEAVFLQEGYRVITYDRRGFGLSSKPSSGYNWDTFANDLDKLLTTLDLRNVTLVGHSMGSGEVTRYLANFGSDRISRAVMISPIPPFLLKTDENEGVPQSKFDEFKDAIKKDRYAFISEFLKNFYNLKMIFGNADLSDEKLRADFNLAASSSPIGFFECVSTWTADFRQDLSKITVPCLVIQGDADKILPFEFTGKKLAEKISAKLVTISGGSHGIPWTHADEISREIIEFMQYHVTAKPQIKSVNISELQ